MAHNANYYLKIKGTVQITNYSCISVFLTTVVITPYILVHTHVLQCCNYISKRGVILADIVILTYECNIRE